MRKEPLSARVARLMKDDYLSSGAAMLPSTEKLCRRYGVSIKTVIAALAKLREEGLVDVRQGRRVRVVSPSGQPLAGEDQSVPSSVSRILLELRQLVLSGQMQAGQPMPKPSFWASTKGVASRTVLKAYRLLAEEGLAHCLGRRWRVGPFDVTSRYAVREVGEIALIMKAPDRWMQLSEQKRTSHFCQTVSAECKRLNVRLVPMLTEGMPYRLSMPTGLSAAQKAIGEMGPKCLGALLISSTQETPDLPQWVKELVKLRKPVVWFDRYDEPVAFAKHRLFTRCHFSEAGGVEEALAHMHAFGHRRIGFPAEYELDWIRARHSMLVERACRLAPAPTVVHHACGSELFWQEEAARHPGVDLNAHKTDMPGVYHAAIRRLIATCNGWRTRGLPWQRRMMESLFEHYPAQWRSIHEGTRLKDVAEAYRRYEESHTVLEHPHPFLSYTLVGYLSDPATTALLSPSDHLAVGYFLWLRASGVSIPNHLSVLSFDNSPETELLPISSVDFGFGHLGYAAFHTLVGDIAINRGSAGDIPSQAAVVQRGSAGFAGQPRF